jgi:hypothetical protein
MQAALMNLFFLIFLTWRTEKSRIQTLEPGLIFDLKGQGLCGKKTLTRDFNVDNILRVHRDIQRGG